MDLEFRVPCSELGLEDPMTSEETERLVDRLQQVLTAAGFRVEIGSGGDDVFEGHDDYDVFSVEEREQGFYTYPELRVEGCAQPLISVRKRDVLFSSLRNDNDEQNAAAEVVRVIRTLEETVLPVPDDVLGRVCDEANRHAVDPDGRIRRPVISRSERRERAIELFARVASPELRRPTAEDFERDHFTRLREMTFDTGPFSTAMSIEPSGHSTSVAIPRGLRGTRAFDDLEREMRAVLKEAIRQPWQATGLPTGVEVRFDGEGLEARLVFDNVVDGGKMVPESRTRRKPHAWDEIAVAAAARDPRFQPSWLPEALQIVAAGGHDVVVNRELTALPGELPPLTLRDRLRSRMPRRR